MTNEIRLLPCNQEIKGKQRCALSNDLMTELGLHLKDVVQLSFPDMTLVCYRWPISDTAVTACIRCDYTVYVHNGISPDIVCYDTPSSTLLQLSVIKKLSPRFLSRISISLITVDYNYAVKYQNDSRLSKLVQSCLRGFAIVNSCTVSCNLIPLGNTFGFHSIYVEDAFLENEYACGLINGETKIEFRNIVSLELLLQQKKFSKLRIGGLTKETQILLSLLRLDCTTNKQKEGTVSCRTNILLRGPPGCGKTLLVNYVAHVANAYLVTLMLQDVMKSRPGEREETVKDIFHKAKQIATRAPCLLFIDDLDALCPVISFSSTAQERSMSLLLARCIDELENFEGQLGVIASTNQPAAVEPSFRRMSRFEKEIFIGVPTLEQRLDILHCLTSDWQLSDDVCLQLIADMTPGYTGADLRLVLQRAAVDAVIATQQKHLKSAVHLVAPSTLRGGEIIQFRPVHWNDIGGLQNEKRLIQQAVELPLMHPEAFQRLGIPRLKGLLLYGPPGCAKTMLVRALASCCHVNLLSVSGAQLYSSYFGSSERKIIEIFRQARASAPCLIFIDEIDAILGGRAAGSQHSSVHERVLSTLLNEMDGIGVSCDQMSRSKQQVIAMTTVDNSDVIVIAATNRPDMIDKALLRPGRFDRLIYIAPPDYEARRQILSLKLKHTPVQDVSVEDLARQTDGYTGAELENLCREAALLALSTEGIECRVVDSTYFDLALCNMTPQINSRDLQIYEQLSRTA